MLRTETILTDRESQVVLGYVKGDNGKEIADRHCMAYRTVVNHTQNAFDKAGCKRSVHALVSWWYQTNYPEIGIKLKVTASALLVVFWISLFGLNDDMRRGRRVREEKENVITRTA